MRRPRFGRCTAWALTAATVAMALGFAGRKWEAGYLGERWSAGIVFGSLWVAWFEPSEGAGLPQLSGGWVLQRTSFSPARRWKPQWADTNNGHVFWIPLWIPAAATALPAAMMWWRHLKAPRAGACPKCRYDHRGLPRADSGETACPECGRVNRAAEPGASPRGPRPEPRDA